MIWCHLFFTIVSGIWNVFGRQCTHCTNVPCTHLVVHSKRCTPYKFMCHIVICDTECASIYVDGLVWQLRLVWACIRCDGESANSVQVINRPGISEYPHSQHSHFTIYGQTVGGPLPHLNFPINSSNMSAPFCRTAMENHVGGCWECIVCIPQLVDDGWKWAKLEVDVECLMLMNWKMINFQ